MQAFSLIHAGFLAAGLAVALPIVIHLLFRQRTRTVQIGSVRFLHQVVREHRRRRRVRQWLLLALRMLAVLLLALLFARPYLDQSYRRGLEQELVLLVDRSASMQAKDGPGQTSFDRARTQLQNALAELDDNAIVHVAFFDAAGVQETPIDQIKDAQTTESATDFGLALAWAGDVLAASQRAQRQIVLLSDLQRSGLPRPRAKPLPVGVELAALDVGGGLPRNLAIESARAIRTEIRPDSQVSLRVTLRNHGPLPARQVVVRCELEGPDGKVVATKPADIAGQGATQVELPLDVQNDGLYRGQVTIEWPDALAIDNRRWVAFEARHPERLLLVDGQEGRSIFSNETYFLETALRLRTAEQEGLSRSFEVERIVWEAGEGFPRLDGYRAVVLANVRRLSDQDGERLEAYVRAGGSLLVFAGDQVSSDSLEVLQAHKLLPGKIASPVDGPFAVDRWDQKHPALACFADPQQGDLRRLRFNRLAPIQEPASGARVLLWAGDRPLAAETALDKGRSLYFGVSADRDWSDFPRTRLYVPLVRQLLAYLTDQLAQRAAVIDRLVTKPTDKIGIAAAPKNPGRWTVTNLDPRESSLGRLTPEEFYQAMGVTKVELEEGEQREVLGLTLPADSLRADEIWTLVAWALLAVLTGEMLLASRVHA